ncbi:MAG: hypothetical protein M3071_15715 [Actinomycetota bacterium]|nr:hypothetical protein [Actinomycetota bacterium]
MPAKTKSLIIVGVAAALASAVAVPAFTTAQTSGGARRITVQEKVVDVVKDDLPPKSESKVSLGDRLITRQSLFDANKKALGTLYTDCSGVGPTKPLFDATLECSATYRFNDGQVVTSGATRLSRGEPIPVTGGTGAYAGARGTVHTTQPATGFDSADLITIDA